MIEREKDRQRVSSGLREVYRKRVWEKHEKREREREKERGNETIKSQQVG